MVAFPGFRPTKRESESHFKKQPQAKRRAFWADMGASFLAWGWPGLSLPPTPPRPHPAPATFSISLRSEKHGESASSGIVLRSVASFHRSGNRARQEFPFLLAKMPTWGGGGGVGGGTPTRRKIKARGGLQEKPTYPPCFGGFKVGNLLVGREGAFRSYLSGVR